MKTAPSRSRLGRGARGGALLAVLWLSTALSAIALALAISTRTELERASSAVDAARAYYLAQGAIERFVLRLATSSLDARAAGEGRFRAGQRRMRWDLPTGVVDLEITGENGKLNLLATPPEALARLFMLLGVDGSRASQIAAGIAARRPGQEGALGNAGLESSFSGQIPSFLQLEDLLTVGGMTPDLYYGWWQRGPALEAAPEGRLVELGGLSRYLTLSDGGAVNVNYAAPGVLRAVGVPDGPLLAMLQAREAGVIEDPGRFGIGSLPGGLQLAGGGAGAYTVRATAQLKGRPVRRSAAALVRFGRDASEPALGIVRWFPAGN